MNTIPLDPCAPDDPGDSMGFDHFDNGELPRDVRNYLDSVLQGDVWNMGADGRWYQSFETEDGRDVTEDITDIVESVVRQWRDAS